MYKKMLKKLIKKIKEKNWNKISIFLFLVLVTVVIGINKTYLMQYNPDDILVTIDEHLVFKGRFSPLVTEKINLINKFFLKKYLYFPGILFSIDINLSPIHLMHLINSKVVNQEEASVLRKIINIQNQYSGANIKSLELILFSLSKDVSKEMLMNSLYSLKDISTLKVIPGKINTFISVNVVPNTNLDTNSAEKYETVLRSMEIGVCTVKNVNNENIKLGFILVKHSEISELQYILQTHKLLELNLFTQHIIQTTPTRKLDIFMYPKMKRESLLAIHDLMLEEVRSKGGLLFCNVKRDVEEAFMYEIYDTTPSIEKYWRYPRNIEKIIKIREELNAIKIREELNVIKKQYDLKCKNAEKAETNFTKLWHWKK